MALKAAWELALERTGGKTAGKLTPTQKSKLAELDKVYTAKIAGEELALQPSIAAARAAGDAETAQKLDEQLRTVVGRLRRKLEEEKDAVRQEKS
jgi:hypothetical protein